MTLSQRLIVWDNNIWLAEQPLSFMKIPFGCRMTIIRLSNGDLFIHSPIYLDEKLKQEVDALGKVRYLVSPNKLHHLYIAQWKEIYPDALTFASPGLTKKRKDIIWDYELNDSVFPDWQDEISQVIIKGSVIMEEAVFWHKSSQTLLVADLVENFNHNSHWSARCITRMVGMYGKPTVPPDWRMTFWHKEELYTSLAIMFNWRWDRVILAHGDLLPNGARAQLTKAISKIAPKLKENKLNENS